MNQGFEQKMIAADSVSLATASHLWKWVFVQWQDNVVKTLPMVQSGKAKPLTKAAAQDGSLDCLH